MLAAELRDRSLCAQRCEYSSLFCCALNFRYGRFSLNVVS
jgi:hypothetical protein